MNNKIIKAFAITAAVLSVVALVAAIKDRNTIILYQLEDQIDLELIFNPSNNKETKKIKVTRNSYFLVYSYNLICV